MTAKYTVVLIVLLMLNPAYGERFSAGTAHWQPYAYTSDEGVYTGICVDIVRELLKRTGHSITVGLYPANRLNTMLKEKKLDMNIADSPMWNPPSEADSFLFTISYMDVVECIYFHSPSNNHPDTVSGLYGKTIGTVLGYYYPMLEEPFKRRDIRRINVANENDLMVVLTNKHVDGAIFDTILFDYLVNKFRFSPGDFKKGIELSTAPLGIKLQPDKREFLDEFNTTLLEMLTDGTIDGIVQNYLTGEYETVPPESPEPSMAGPFSE